MPGNNWLGCCKVSGAALPHIGNGFNDAEVSETTNMQNMHIGRVECSVLRTTPH
jgi:hypothetical protein